MNAYERTKRHRVREKNVQINGELDDMRIWRLKYNKIVDFTYYFLCDHILCKATPKTSIPLLNHIIEAFEIVSTSPGIRKNECEQRKRKRKLQISLRLFKSSVWLTPYNELYRISVFAFSMLYDEGQNYYKQHANTYTTTNNGIGTWRDRNEKVREKTRHE